MPNNEIVILVDNRWTLSWRLSKIFFFFLAALAVLSLSAASAIANDNTLETVDPTLHERIDAAAKPHRRSALLSLLTNERRSIEQRIQRVTGELERLLIADDESRDDVTQAALDDSMKAALDTLQEELAALHEQKADVIRKLAKVHERQREVSADALSADSSQQNIFIPAIRPRNQNMLQVENEEQLRLSARMQVQEALILLGGYDSTVDGDLGPRTRTAIRRFQTGLGAEPTGRLTEEQAGKLLDQAAALRREYRVRPMVDDDIGFRLIYASALLPNEERSGGGYRLLTSDDGSVRLQVVVIDSRDLRTIFEDLTRHQGAAYRHFTSQWFVASGEVDGDMFYSMGRRARARSIVAHLTYPSSERERWDPFAVVLYNSFELTDIRE